MEFIFMSSFHVKKNISFWGDLKLEPFTKITLRNTPDRTESIFSWMAVECFFNIVAQVLTKRGDIVLMSWNKRLNINTK